MSSYILDTPDIAGAFCDIFANSVSEDSGRRRRSGERYGEQREQMRALLGIRVSRGAHRWI